MADVFNNAFPSSAGTVPAATDVRLGVAVGQGTGTLRVPSVDDVRLNVAFDAADALLGTVRVPPVDKVELGYMYDANDTLTGTLDPGGGATDYPTAGDVRDGVSYNFGALVGTLVSPAEPDVRSGVGYGAGGVEYVGSWTGGDAGAGLSDRGWIG